MIRRLRALASLVALLQARAAFADDSKPVEVVVTGTRTPESSQRTTVRTDLVTAKEAERRGATNVAEALAGEPTLQVNPGNYGILGRPSGAQMQGLDGDRVLVLEDGERVIGDRDGVVDLSLLPLADVERIEYVSGPTSSLYGSNALGGVINVVSAPPRALGPSGRYRAEGRSTGEALASATAAYRHDDDWLVLDGSYHRRPGIERQPGEPDLLAPKWRSTLLGVRAGTRLSRRVELKLRARWVRDRSDGLESERVPGIDTLFIRDLPQTTDRFLLRAQETVDLPGKARVDFSLARSWFVDDYRRDLRSSPVDERRHSKLSNQGLEAIVTLPDGAARTWVFGLRSDAEHYSQELTRTLPDLTRQRVTEISPQLLATGALYGQLGWKVTERATLMPGARVELHDRYGVVAAPRLATAYRFSDAWSTRLALGRGFRAPSAKEFGFLFDHSALGYRVLGNTALRPESSWGLTGDVTARFERLRVRVGAFGNLVRDLISFELARDGATTGVTDYIYRNVDRAITAGGDIGARYKPFEALSLDANYAYLWTRDRATGDPLPNRPAHTVTLSALIAWGKLEAVLRYRVVSRAFVDRLDDGSAERSPGFGLLDARVAYRFHPALDAFVGALNLVNERRDPLNLIDTRPALGRQFYLGVSGRLEDE